MVLYKAMVKDERTTSMFIYGHSFAELKERVKKDEQSEDRTVH